MSQTSLKERIEDHALESVPDSEREGWLKLTWNTAGIVTTLIQIFFGALACFVAGFKIALLAGATVTIVGSLLGWACGHIAYKTGLSSTVMARQFGYGRLGSVVASAIFGFMIIGFLALENALLFEGFAFYFQLEHSLFNQIVIYAILTMFWVLLTLFGFDLVSKFSSATIILFLLLLVYMSWYVFNQTGVSLAEATSFGSILPAEALAGMGATSDLGKYIFCVNLFIGSAGALALVDADLGRYARSSKDIGIAAFMGNFAMDILMVIFGGLVMYAASQILVDHYVALGMDVNQANQKALSPDGVAAVFILFGGLIGAGLMVLAQAKAQVLNTYSGSLSLSNLFDAISIRLPRYVQVILANVLALAMIAGDILGLVNSWITMLGVLTTTFAGVMIADYFVIKRGNTDSHRLESVNWAGLIATAVAAYSAHFLLDEIISVQFISSFCISVILYSMLRSFVFKAPQTQS